MDEEKFIISSVKELTDNFEIIASDSISFVEYQLEKLKIPLSENLTGMNREETMIDWNKMSYHYKFYCYYVNNEEKVKKYLEKSKLNHSKNIIITYGWNDPVIKLPTNIFIEKWEDFLIAIGWEPIIFSEDFKLIIELSRDLCIHSNFFIQKDQCYKFK